MKALRRSVISAVALVVMIPVLASCSNGSSSSTGAPSSTKPSTTPITDPRLKIVNEPGARADVKITSCTFSGGGWTTSGTVSNSTSASASYGIQIAYTDAGSTVQDVEYAHATVAAGGSSGWSTIWKTTTSAGINCILDAVSRK